ncbi:MAG: GNAT family N-acetyltransferase [Inquilinus sp.]|uniref:GNAT family N-acetyltransferase n=1 Tax=Inquilinus sp. TaxID=1932117 RepID=UPI003F35DA56
MDDASKDRSAGLTLRPATAADAGTLAAIHRRARESAAIPNLHSRTSIRRFLLRTVQQSQVMIACHDGTPVGYAALHNGWLDQLYIHPEHHRRGIGTALLAWARHESRELRLYCFAHNARALAFYQAHGGVILSEGDGSDNEEGLPDLLLGFPET